MTESDSNFEGTADVDGELARVAQQQATPLQPPTPLQTAPRIAGRRYGFLCSYCSSRLEATDSMAAQSGTCPTCGNTIIIPILDNRGRLIDPTTNEIIKQNPHPVHAYAAAGHRAPQIIPASDGNERVILCPRCQRQNAMSSNNCSGCGLPFTMDGTAGESIAGSNTWAVASLVLGIVGIPTFCLVVPALLAIVFGVLALRGSNQPASAQAGRGMAIAGIVLGVISVVITGLFWARFLRI
jgi:predicted RNA-binding Zn-ribbon protein involved in translation (DUF1610 family)